MLLRCHLRALLWVLHGESPVRHRTTFLAYEHCSTRWNSVRVKVGWVACQSTRSSVARPDMLSPPRRQPGTSPRKPPITVDRITDAALEVVATQGYEALTMRSVATLLGHRSRLAVRARGQQGRPRRADHRPPVQPAGPARARPGDVARADLDVCAQLRDQYLKLPGISRAALAMVVTDLDVLRVNEGMLAILLAGGVSSADGRLGHRRAVPLRRRLHAWRSPWSRRAPGQAGRRLALQPRTSATRSCAASPPCRRPIPADPALCGRADLGHPPRTIRLHARPHHRHSRLTWARGRGLIGGGTRCRPDRSARPPHPRGCARVRRRGRPAGRPRSPGPRPAR